MESEKLVRAAVYALERDDGHAVVAAHVGMLSIHAKAMLCHCECLAMNADNCIAAAAGCTPSYDEAAFYSVMKKWGMLDDKGDSNI